MPFCIACGVRVDSGVQRCPACEARSSTRPACPNCGASTASTESRFCVGCGSPIAASVPPQSSALPRATAPPQSSAPPPAKSSPAPTTPAAAQLIQSARNERAAVYQRLGRQLIGACYEGRLRYDALPDELARQTKAGIETIRKGHATLARSGICPRCLETTLAGAPATCSRCKLVIPPGKEG